MNRLILHAYDLSPFTQKALLMLGIKGADWRWVETPMLPPKDALTCLTGGYRGTPVLQDGADVYIDSQLIALELDRRQPEPPLLPPAIAGLGLLSVEWSDVFFRAVLRRIIAETAASWPEAFRADRAYLFPDIDFEATAEDLPHTDGQFRAYAALLNTQLADGRPYLAGDQPTLLDIQAWPFLAMARSNEGASALLHSFGHLPAWEERGRAVGEGTRVAIAADEALAEARDAEPATIDDPGTAEAGAPSIGSRVQVSPDDTRRGGVTGELVALDERRVVLRHSHERIGQVHVHLPRIGYRVTALA